MPLGDAGLVVDCEQQAELCRGDAGDGQAATICGDAELVRCPLQQQAQALVGLEYVPTLTGATGGRHLHLTYEMRYA